MKSSYILNNFFNCHYSSPSRLFPNSAWRLPMMRNLLFSETTDHIIKEFPHKYAVNGLQIVKILNISALRQAGVTEPLFSTMSCKNSFIFYNCHKVKKDALLKGFFIHWNNISLSIMSILIGPNFSLKQMYCFLIYIEAHQVFEDLL